MPTSLLTVTPLTASGISHVGFIPSQITGLVAWYAGNAIAGTASGTSISVWTDLSGNNNHASRSLVTQQPRFIEAVQNNLGVVRWTSGTSQWLDAPSTGTIAQPFTVFSVCSLPAAATNAATLGSMTNNTNFGKNASNILSMFAGSTAQMNVSLTSTWEVIGAICNGSSTTMRVRNSSTSSIAGGFAAGAQSITSGLEVGGTSGNGTNPWTGDIGEALIWNRALTPAEFLTIDSYLATKWGIP